MIAMNKLGMIIIFGIFLSASASNAASLFNYCASSGFVKVTAPWYCSSINQQVINSWNKWSPVVLVVMMLSFAIAAAVFMTAMIFKNERLRTFAIGEMYEATATAIIAVFFLLIAATLFGAFTATITGPIDPYNASLSYISTTINATQNLVVPMLNDAVVDAFYASFRLTVCVPNELDPLEPQCYTNIGKILTVPIMVNFYWPVTTVVGLMIDALISLYVQYYIILFFMYAAIPVFLIPGIAFRALLPTRSFGGMMMAAAIGFYFIMPVLFSIAYYFTSASLTSQLSTITTSVNKYSAGNGAQQNAISPSSPLVLDVQEANSAFSSFWLSTLFFPTLIIAITYSTIVQMGEIIGGMARTSGRLRLVV
jgi:hypothetical protein